MLKVLDVQLCKSSYLVGDNFSLADIPAGCWFNRCRNFEIDISSFEGVTSWAKKLYDRKAFQSVLLRQIFRQIKEFLIYFIYSTNHSKNWSYCNASTYSTAKNRSFSIFNLKLYISCGFCF